MANFLVLLVLGAIFLSSAPAGAQLAAPASKADAGGDLYGRDSPRGLSNGLLGALAAQDYDRASRYFDLAAVPAANRKAIGAVVARRLQQALDAGGSLIQPMALSNQASGRIDDQLAPNEERIGDLPAVAGRDAQPLIAMAGSQDGKTVWLISRGSLAAILRTPTAEGQSLRDRMPRFLREISVFGAPLSDWLLLLGVALAFWFGVRFLCLAVLLLVVRLYPGRKESWWCRVLNLASTSLSLWIGMMLFIATTRTLEASIVARQIVNRMAGAIALLAFAWFVWRMVDLAADLVAGRMKRSKRLRARSILIFMRRAVKLLILIVAGIQALKILGLDVTTGIAALGIGGIAIALGAQKTVENLVGSVSVVADEPIRVGDWCKVGDVIGTVEEIGIRSTRIRTNDRTIVTIPNGNFSALQIENFSARDRYLFDPVFRLSIDLDAATVERVMKGLRAMLKEAAYLYEGARANVRKFGDNWIEVEIFAWINVPDRVKAIELREQLLLGIMRSVESAGGRFFGANPPKAAARPAPVPSTEKPAENRPAVVT
ncbi:MAG: mechanosensitive ion channel family protein [Sphingobium sp.]|nr:mechanosensitive ion channel family protein [Sphingobium sp.]